MCRVIEIGNNRKFFENRHLLSQKINDSIQKVFILGDFYSVLHKRSLGVAKLCIKEICARVDSVMPEVNRSKVDVTQNLSSRFSQKK